MKYRVQKLDGRFSYNNMFQYCLGFEYAMSRDQGPLMFNHALRWCVQTWGWSAEIRQYHEISRWINRTVILLQPLTIGPKPGTDLPRDCNPNWSWSNGFDDLRIYLASEQELAFFQLAHPNDQKK